MRARSEKTCVSRSLTKVPLLTSRSAFLPAGCGAESEDRGVGSVMGSAFTGVRSSVAAARDHECAAGLPQLFNTNGARVALPVAALEREHIRPAGTTSQQVPSQRYR